MYNFWVPNLNEKDNNIKIKETVFELEENEKKY